MLLNQTAMDQILKTLHSLTFLKKMFKPSIKNPCYCLKSRKSISLWVILKFLQEKKHAHNESALSYLIEVAVRIMFLFVSFILLLDCPKREVRSNSFMTFVSILLYYFLVFYVFASMSDSLLIRHFVGLVGHMVEPSQMTNQYVVLNGFCSYVSFNLLALQWVLLLCFL